MNKITTKELRWIEEEPLIKRPIFDDPVDLSQPKKRKPYTKRLMDNFITPVCLLATVGCLSFGLFNMYRGNSAKQQFYMRGRVACQGIALLTMIIGMNSMKKNK